MSATTGARLVEAVREVAFPLTGSGGDHDPLLELVGDARVVLLGEASHGTHEFYRTSHDFSADCPSSSTPCCTSTRRGRWSRSRPPETFQFGV
jgi:hypothetical protein